MELVTILLYTQVFDAFFAIQASLRLYSGRIQLTGACRVFRYCSLYSGSIQALLRRIQHTGARRVFGQHTAHPVAVAQRGLPVFSSASIKALFSFYSGLN
jgi:hypothetical protein